MTHTGLTTQQANEKLQSIGLNEIKAGGQRSPLSIFLAQFASFLVALLFVAAGVSYYFNEVIDAVFIITIIILNACLGFYQEFKAEKAVEALSKMARSQVRVIRDGKETQIESTEIVPDDIIVLSEGDKIIADGVLLETSSLEVNESALTGESEPVKKDTSNQANVFSGTLVNKGHGVMKVSQTGMNTRFGKIAQTLSKIEDRETPLQKQLSKLGVYLGIAAIITCILVFFVGLLRGIPTYEILLLSISLAVAAVPEGLPAIVTITLALGVTQMAKRNAIVRKLAAVETLGSVQIICTDKTGTLTTNQMTVREVWINKSETGLADYRTIGIVCNTAKLTEKEGHVTVLGDTTEGALLTHAQDQNLNYEQVRSQHHIIEEFPFDSNRKMMSMIVSSNREKIKNELEGKVADNLVFAKGAPEVILSKSTSSEETKTQAHNIIEQYASQGLRTLALAYKPITNPSTHSQDAIESELILVAIAGIADPPRKEVKVALKEADSAGVRTIMVTGDNLQTAIAIGKELGLYKEGKNVALEGSTFAKLSDKEIEKQLKTISIIARCQPEDKLRLVTLLQKNNYVIASTGDGVNDALHIKKADIGIAMGITGTDVSKEASDMVLGDDNYATIVAAIEEGRRIYHNIKNAIHYLISTNIGEILAIVGSILLFPGGEAPRTPLMVLWINLVTDGLPALALATDVVDKRLMKQPPREKEIGIVNKKDWLSLFFFGILIATTTLITFYVGYMIGGVALGRTWSFIAIVFMQLIRLVLIRKASPFNNWKIAGVLIFTLALQIFVSYWEPSREILGISE